MCISTNAFFKPFSILKEELTRSRSPMPQSADIANNDLARPSSDPLILITPSSTIRAADIAIPVTSDHLEVPEEGVVDHPQQVLPSSSDFLSSHLPTSPPIAPTLNVGLLSTADQVGGPVGGVVNLLKHPSSILTGSCLLQISVFYS
ncbi:hypothetical protein K443DRAFT_681665 [Laccaria amethystina LaAM-08-1]|uniref:Uncharacterized protein n=1 Tax=Laccaria amethystina LaAM-08-1 TaxID=1095629 RepID=A0A0C9WLI3_9AGAR|nr:hypothetical protein K443DRAFT_681665 [Laccaria amethystina LaAM-08-1]